MLSKHLCEKSGARACTGRNFPNLVVLRHRGRLRNHSGGCGGFGTLSGESGVWSFRNAIVMSGEERVWESSEQFGKGDSHTFRVRASSAWCLKFKVCN